MIRNCLMILVVALIAACNTNIHKARFVLLPDTQYYAEKFPAVLDSQINWIVRNAKDINLVIQQGDLTQNNNDKEWQIVKTAFSKLDNKIPYVLAAGNHDMGSAAGKFADTRNSTLFNQYFPFTQMSKLPAFAGTFEQNKIENAFYLTQTGKIKWLIITLEFGPRNAVLDWASNIINQHPDRTVIINTHCYMYSDSTRQGPGDNWRPQAYGVGKDTGDSSVNDGEQIWEKLVKKNQHIRFVFSGHVLNTGVGTLVSINNEGYPVYQMLANYQEGVKGSIKGGNGWLRIIDMDFKKKTIAVATYSPYINEFMNDPAQKFLIRNVMFEPNNK